MVQRIHKATMQRVIRTMRMWEGYVTPNNVNSMHVTGGWRIGVNVLLTQGRDNKFYVVNEHYNKTDIYDDSCELEEWLSNYQYHNCVKELGRRVQFWE